MEDIQEVVEVPVNELEVLVDTLEQQNKVKSDIIIPAGHIRYEGGVLYTGDSVSDQYTPTELAHEQIAEKLGIPIGYYRTMRGTHEGLLEQNINGWLSKKETTKYLLRTFKYPDTDNVCRAMLSNRYNILDNWDVLMTALKVIKEAGVNVRIQEAKVTEKRMYLHIVAPEIEIEAEELLKDYLTHKDQKNVGNGIISGLVVTNSETGHGTFEVSPLAHILRCNNGLIDRKASVKRVHLGAKMDTGVIDWSASTKNKNYELIMAMTQDAVKTFLSKDYLGGMVKKLETAKGIAIQHPEGCIEHLAKDMGIVNEEQKMDILRYFLRDGDESALGIAHAVTRSAQQQSPDQKYEWEAKAFELLPRIHSYDKPLSKN